MFALVKFHDPQKSMNYGIVLFPKFITQDIVSDCVHCTDRTAGGVGLTWSSKNIPLVDQSPTKHNIEPFSESTQHFMWRVSLVLFDHGVTFHQ